MRLLFSFAAASLLVAHAATAAITLVSESRSVSASATAVSASGTNTQGPFSASPPGPGLGWNTNNSAGASATTSGSGAAASSIQVSGWTIAGPLTLDAQGSASTSTNVTTTSGGISALASASSIFEVVFDVDAGTTLSLNCSSGGVSMVRLENLTTSQLLFSGSGFYDGTLGPARIRLYADAIAVNNAPPGGSLGGGYSLLFNATPTPAAAPLLLCGGCFLARRRRS